MALTQEQVDWWFSQNPEATADEVAAAVQAVGGLEGNEGLAGMIANRYAISEPEVTNYYNAYTVPGGYGGGYNVAGGNTTTSTASTSTPTVIDTVTSGTPTTQTELLATLADIPTPTKSTFTDTIPTVFQDEFPTTKTIYEPALVDLGDGTFRTPGGTIIDKDGRPVNQTATQTNTSTTVDTTNPLVALYQSTLGRAPTQEEIDSWNFGDTIDAGELDRFLGAARNEAVTTLPTNSVAGTLAQQILAQGKTSLWGGEGYGSTTKTAYDMGVLLAGQGLTDISQLGQKTITIPAHEELVETGDGFASVTVPEKTVTQFINKVTGQPIESYYDKASQNGEDIWGGTFAGEGSTAYGVKFDAKGNPIFYSKYGGSSSDLADYGPLIQLASVIPSPLQPFAIAVSAGMAIDNGDILGGIASLAGLAGFSDVAAAARITKAAQSGDPFAIVTSVMNSPFADNIGGTMLTDTISLKDAGNAVTLVNSALNNNWAGALTAAGQLTGSSDVATAAAAARFINASKSGNMAAMYTASQGFANAVNAANKVTDKDVASNIANSLADANKAATEGTQLASLASDTVSDAGNGYTMTGADGSTLTFPDFSSSDTINADAALFNSTIGDLDAVGTDTTTGGNITDTTGLDTGDVIPVGDDVDEMVITGKGNATDLSTTGIDTITGGVGNDVKVDDKGSVTITGSKESCPVGTKLNPITGECDPDWDETGVECAPGFHDDGTGMCVADTDTTETTECADGMVRDLTTGQCVWPAEECAPGFHDNGSGLCVPDDEKPLDCPEGYEPNDDNTACIPVIEIQDKRCDPGFVYDEELKQCVAIPEEPCADGYHRDASGLCVPDEEEPCEPGYHRENGVCVPDECPEGYIRDMETGTCVPAEKPCPDGYHRDASGACVPDDEPCADGYHLENGICVPDEDPCDEGYHRENGVCVPDECPEGYIRNLETGACEKVEDKSCPVGQVRNADGKCVPITKTNECQPGYERVNGVCVPVCQPGYVRVDGVCKKIPTTTTTATPSTSGLSAEGERTDPIYAGGMDTFNLLATLQELLAEEAPKKDDKKSKDKTKMATGGHLDDLLAEQMTVDDLLKLLR